MLRGFPLDPKDSIKILDNMYRVVVPLDCDYTETIHHPKKEEDGSEKLVPEEVDGTRLGNYVIDGKAQIMKTLRTTFIHKEEALKKLDEINEWARRKGGRPKGS